MRQNENYTGFVVSALILTLGIFGTFQFYITREPERITTDEKRDQLIATTAGRTLYSENCMMCHAAGVMEPVPDIPAESHEGRGNETCLWCHTQAGGILEQS